MFGYSSHTSNSLLARAAYLFKPNLVALLVALDCWIYRVGYTIKSYYCKQQDAAT